MAKNFITDLIHLGKRETTPLLLRHIWEIINEMIVRGPGQLVFVPCL